MQFAMERLFLRKSQMLLPQTNLKKKKDFQRCTFMLLEISINTLNSSKQNKVKKRIWFNSSFYYHYNVNYIKVSTCRVAWPLLSHAILPDFYFPSELHQVFLSLHSLPLASTESIPKACNCFNVKRRKREWFLARLLVRWPGNNISGSLYPVKFYKVHRTSHLWC